MGCGRLVLLLLGIVLLGGCDLGFGGGGSGGSKSSSSVAAATAIDLPAGQMQARLAWAPSEGDVESYSVFESRNSGDYEFLGSVPEPSVTLSGSPGDALRVVVVAMNHSGGASQPSPPSPELRFHAGSGTGDEVAAATAAESSPVVNDGPSTVEPETVALDESGSSDVEPVASASEPESASDPSVSEPSGSTAADRELFVQADTRLPVRLSESAEQWIQTRVEAEFAAGVRLVGTGERDQDGLRELIWQDNAGQLFVSAGSAIVDVAQASEIPSTFEEGLRLRATERFVALADFDGDAVGDWVVADESTGDVWIIDATTLDSLSARGESNGLADATLVGHGDFDADGREEFVWQHPDGSLELDHPTRTLPILTIGLPNTARILNVADVNDDGYDDLLTTDLEQRLEAFVIVEQAAEGGLSFASQSGPALGTAGLDPLVTADIDGDGRAEIAWLDGEVLEVWDVATGPRDF